MCRVGGCDGRRGDQVQVLRIRRGAAGPVVGAGQGDGAVDDHGLGMRDPGLIIDPDRHSRRGQWLHGAVALARRGLVGNQPNVDAALLGVDQRLDDAGPVGQAIGADKDLMLGVADRSIGKGGTIFLGREANCYLRTR